MCGGPSGLTVARVPPTQVKRNLLSVSYHIAQYTDVISNLRGKIERLKSKIERQEQEKKREPGVRDTRGRARRGPGAAGGRERQEQTGPLLAHGEAVAGKEAGGLAARAWVRRDGRPV